jgi:hypothetical protein
MSQAREKFTTQVNSKILKAVRALAGLVKKHKNAKPRAHVLGANIASHERYGPLYKKLAR